MKTDIERLKYELKKAEEDLKQKEFFVTWLKSNIHLEKIKKIKRN